MGRFAVKKFNWIVVTSILLLLAAGVACQPGGQQLEIRLAPIHEVNVAIAESFPPQVIVHIQGGLSDGCTTFHDLKTERSGNTVNITVTTQRPRGAICTQVYGFFEQNVNLGSDFASGQTYTINVNDKTTSFVMQ
jgi:inhibitor of cysteine peptidase